MRTIYRIWAVLLLCAVGAGAATTNKLTELTRVTTATTNDITMIVSTNTVATNVTLTLHDLMGVLLRTKQVGTVWLTNATLLFGTNVGSFEVMSETNAPGIWQFLEEDGAESISFLTPTAIDKSTTNFLHETASGFNKLVGTNEFAAAVAVASAPSAGQVLTYNASSGWMASNAVSASGVTWEIALTNICLSNTAYRLWSNSIPTNTTFDVHDLTVIAAGPTNTARWRMDGTWTRHTNSAASLLLWTNYSQTMTNARADYTAYLSNESTYASLWFSGPNHIGATNTVVVKGHYDSIENPLPYIAAAPAWTPASLTGLGGWWKPDDLYQATNVLNIDGTNWFVNWPDSSGYSHDMTPQVTNYSPILSTNMLNGYSLVLFPPSNSVIMVDQVVTPSMRFDGSYYIEQPYSIWALVLPTNTTATKYIVQDYGNTAPNPSSGISDNSSEQLSFSAGTSLVSTESAVIGEWMFVCVWATGATSRIYHNLTLTDGNAGTNGWKPMTLGARYDGDTFNFQGWMVELGYTTNQMTGAEVTNVWTYLTNKYGLSLAL